jgi:hypothetical protein
MGCYIFTTSSTGQFLLVEEACPNLPKENPRQIVAL